MADSRYSYSAPAGSRLLDCFYCQLKKGIIQNHGAIKIGKPNGKLIAFMVSHHEQELNLPYLKQRFEQFLRKNNYPITFSLLKINGHLVAEACGQGNL